MLSYWMWFYSTNIPHNKIKVAQRIVMEAQNLEDHSDTTQRTVCVCLNSLVGRWVLCPHMQRLINIYEPFFVNFVQNDNIMHQNAIFVYLISTAFNQRAGLVCEKIKKKKEGGGFRTSPKPGVPVPNRLQ